jgi:hypothetical protein
MITNRHEYRGAPMPLFGRKQEPPKPVLNDEALLDLSIMFTNCPQRPTPGVELLDAAKMDFSIESLAFVDDFLDEVRSRPLTDRETKILVLRCGAYVGEVLRRNSSLTWHWVDYDEALRVDPKFAAIGEKNLGVVSVLWSGTKYSFPLNKVGKFLINGREDSTKFFVQVMLSDGPTAKK